MTDRSETSASLNQSESANQDLINRLAFAAVDEQRKARRWGIFFKFLMFAYLLGLLFLYWPNKFEAGDNDEHTALVELSGVIASDQDANADTIITGLRDAFENENAKGIILRINSPGGSPVQAGYINDEIKRLRTKYPDKPFYAVVADICASGGYYVAAAAEKIYADKASMVGSIGVLMNGFGFVDTMNKLGVERRLFTAGENKGFLDPFQPTKDSDVQHVKLLLADIHQQFIDTVKEGRGDKLKDSPDLFSGLIWNGEQAVQMGLVDELASSSYVAREVIGAETIIDYTPQPNLFERVTQRFGVALGRGVGQVLGGGQGIRLQ